MNYYNENDAYAAQWLRNLIAEGLIPDGHVDERSIEEVKGKDLEGYAQCHFFAGIGGWPYALELAGWPSDEPVWTGSCPCQAFSSATHGISVADEKWPEWKKLIAEAQPRVLFGEQVASAKKWIDSVFDDLEEMDYACGASILPACSVGADHIRQRVWFYGYSHGYRESGRKINAKASGVQGRDCVAERMGEANGISVRLAQLRAYGNAIVPQVAAEFIGAFMEARS